VSVGEFLKDHWGDLASVLGLAITIWLTWRAKKAAEQARDAAQQVKARISNLDMLADISAAVATLDEIKRLQRLAAWDVALDRYTVVRKHLVRVEQMKQGLTELQLQDIGKAIRQFRIIEAKVEREKANPAQEPIDPAKLNGIVADQGDILEKLMIAIKQAGI
jgi:hypothetical protein